MLNKPAFQFFTKGEIKPEGWLKRQLRIQADGLSGNLDKVWPDVRDSRWIGGDREGWERVPYWLDGLSARGRGHDCAREVLRRSDSRAAV